MTVLTKPGWDTRTDPGPVSWKGMLWVTWRQHRGLLISITATFTVAVIAMAVEGLKIHRDYAAVTACHLANSGACPQMTSESNTD